MNTALKKRVGGIKICHIQIPYVCSLLLPSPSTCINYFKVLKDEVTTNIIKASLLIAVIMVQNAGTVLGLTNFESRFVPKHHVYAYAQGSSTKSLTIFTELSIITPLLSTGYGEVW